MAGGRDFVGSKSERMSVEEVVSRRVNSRSAPRKANKLISTLGAAGREGAQDTGYR